MLRETQKPMQRPSPKNQNNRKSIGNLFEDDLPLAVLAYKKGYPSQPIQRPFSSHERINSSGQQSNISFASTLSTKQSTYSSRHSRSSSYSPRSNTSQKKRHSKNKIPIKPTQPKSIPPTKSTRPNPSKPIPAKPKPESIKEIELPFKKANWFITNLRKITNKLNV